MELFQRIAAVPVQIVAIYCGGGGDDDRNEDNFGMDWKTVEAIWMDKTDFVVDIVHNFGIVDLGKEICYTMI